MRGARPYGSGSFYPPAPTSSTSDAMDHSSSQQHCVTLPHRPAAAAPGVGKSSTSLPSSSHGHVKIGRRPAHLPKVLKFSDKTLPPGWVRKLKQRKHGKQAGRWDVYIYSPCGVKFASRKKLKGFFEKNNLNYDPEDFDFTPYGRHIDSRVAGQLGTGSTSGSRHNSSGSTGSDGTHPGSSPASISNYSPTHSSPYMPQSMALGATSLMSHHATAASIAGQASTFGDYSSFTQFDPHMENPPNASALDVPGTEFSPLSTAGTATLPYQHLGRGHHHPFINKEMGAAGSEFFPSAEMAEILGGSSVDAMHNGLTGMAGGGGGGGVAPGGAPTGYSDLSRLGVSSGGLQPLSNASLSSRTSDEDGEDSKANIISSIQLQQHNNRSSAAPTSTAASSSSTAPVASVIGAPASLLAQQQAAAATLSVASAASSSSVTSMGASADAQQDKVFSLGRTMSVLQANHDGFEDYSFY